MSNHLMNTYAALPVAFERGEGAWLWDEEGKCYLDAISGLGVCALGHAHPAVTRVIAEQAGRLINSMCERGVLISRIGPSDNILKLRPPMPFSRDNAQLLLSTLDDALAAL